MATAKKRGDKWRVQMYTGMSPTGKKQYKQITAATKKEAEKLAAQYKADLEYSHDTLRGVISRYIDDRQAIFSPKTVLEYRRSCEIYAQGIMDVPIRRLNRNMIQREINKETQRLSPKTVRNIWGIISAALKTEGIHFEIKLPQKEKKEIVVPEEDEMQEILGIVSGTQFEVPVLLAAFCGLRRSEIAALDFNKDVDFSNNTVSVTKAMVKAGKGDWVIKQPKTYASNRVITAPQAVMDAIKRELDSGKDHTIHPAFITSGFAKKMRGHDKKLRFHDLRHFHASMLLALGIPDKYAAERMGHATTNMLKNVYQHTMKQKTDHFSDMIVEHAGRIMQEKVQAEIQAEIQPASPPPRG